MPPTLRSSSLPTIPMSDDIEDSFSDEEESSQISQTSATPTSCRLRPPISSMRQGPLVKSYTHDSHLPTIINDNADEEFVLGVDEAGRGPVLGPMVYSSCYCAKSRYEELKKIGFVDSKTIKEEVRDRLFDIIESLSDFVGWSVRVLSPHDISTGMLRRSKYSLNDLAHDTTINLIRWTLQKGVNVTEIYIDTVGTAETYQKKLMNIFPGIMIKVAKKADRDYPIVSAASICAKVTRDNVLRNWTFLEKNIDDVSNQFGSGYPADPNTVNWLKQNMDPIFGYPNVIRFSWATCKNLLEGKGKKVLWPEESTQNLTMCTSKRGRLFEKMALKIVNEF